jgi:nitroimidazol reductase NimA-like FMN-containing flavoprotein (pyridoxamine 5'-phosphate oxidase superfamily)
MTGRSALCETVGDPDDEAMTESRRELTVEECLARLRTSALGRISVTKDALPVIVPTKFTFDERGLGFHVPAAGWLARACDANVVAFEVDEASASGDIAWSVLVLGVAALASAPSDDREVRVSVDIQRISGHEGIPLALARRHPEAISLARVAKRCRRVRQRATTPPDA